MPPSLSDMSHKLGAMSPRLLLVLLVVVISVTVYAILDCARRRPESIKAMPKLAWIAVIVLLPVLGPVLWFLLGRVRPAGGRTPERPGPLAPDDDPDFLRRLEEEQRRGREDSD